MSWRRAIRARVSQGNRDLDYMIELKKSDRNRCNAMGEYEIYSYILERRQKDPLSRLAALPGTRRSCCVVVETMPKIGICIKSQHQVDRMVYKRNCRGDFRNCAFRLDSVEHQQWARDLNYVRKYKEKYPREFDAVKDCWFPTFIEKKRKHDPDTAVPTVPILMCSRLAYKRTKRLWKAAELRRAAEVSIYTPPEPSIVQTPSAPVLL